MRLYSCLGAVGEMKAQRQSLAKATHAFSEKEERKRRTKMRKYGSDSVVTLNLIDFSGIFMYCSMCANYVLSSVIDYIQNFSLSRELKINCEGSPANKKR